MNAQPAPSLTSDICLLTALYLAALKSNSDEIINLAAALRLAEAERDALIVELATTRIERDAAKVAIAARRES